MNKFQKNILKNEIFCGGTAVSNIGGIIRFSADISYPEVNTVVKEIIRKTPSLRLRAGRENELYEESYEEGYNVKKIEIKGGYDEFFPKAEDLFRLPFKCVYDSSLYEFVFFEYDGGKAGFLKLHHILGDAVSIVIFCKLVDEGLLKLRAGEEFICESTPVIYRDISEAKRERACAYFDNMLKNRDLGGRLGQKAVNNYDADRFKFSLPLYKKGMPGEVLTALYVYVSSVTNSKRVVFGNVLGNRLKGEMEMIGMFANTLPLALEFEGEECFSDACKAVNRELFTELKYSFYSLEDFRELNGINENLFEIAVSYKSAEFLPNIKTGEVIEMFNGCVDAPMRIFAEERGDRLVFNVHYKKDVFAKEFIENMCLSIAEILKQGFENKKLSEIEILSERDKKAYEKLNNTKAKHKYSDVIECFKEHISDGEAVACGNKSITGFELDEMSDSIACFLAEKGAKTAGIKMKRSYKMIVSVLGALKAGAAFMIVSDVIPHMDRHCDIVIDEKLFDKIPKGRYVCGKYNPEDTAYMVWTSGSTGKPKCAEISRGSLMSRMEWAENLIGFNCSILQKTVNTFDVSVWEMLSVIYGARLCILPEGCEKLPDKTAEALINYNINMVHFVPSMLDIFIKYAKLKGIRFPHLKTVVASGEKLEPSTVCEFKDILGARLFNLYGPAECTIDVTAYECVGENEDIPIGKPADNTQIYILNDSNKIMPVGIDGEIVIAGELVGKGYADGDKGGFFSFGGEKAYKTGDIGRLGCDGNIYICGRKDRQVKIRGMRINLSEIKNIVLGCEGVTACEVIKNENRIECYFCGNCDVEVIKAALLKSLQVYAVPSRFIRVSEIPLTNNGKADIKALMEFKEKTKTEAEDLTDNERLTLAEINKYTAAGIDDNVFEKGLDSLSILEIVCALQEKGLNISFGDFYEGLSARGSLKIAGGKRYYKYINEVGAEELMICLPCGGGEPQSLEGLFRGAGYDVIGVYTSAFDENASIEAMADMLVKILPLSKYKRIYLYGQCVGSAAALELADKIGEKVKNIFLVSPSAKTKASRLSPWDYIPDRVIIKTLVKAGGDENFYTKNVLHNFRKDTRRYFKYQPKRYENIKCCVNVVFGESDIFTKDSEKIIKSLKAFVDYTINVKYIKGGSHFLNTNSKDKLSAIINRYL